MPFAMNPYERRILSVIFLSASLPVFLVVGFFYCLFSDIIYTYLQSDMADESVRQFLELTILILLYYFFFVWILGYHFVHKLVGAFPRIFRELDEKISGKLKAPIHLRKGDFGKDLIKRINSLADKLFS